MKKGYFLLIAALYAIAVFFLASTTPITPHEAKIFYTSADLVAQLMKWGEGLIGGFLGLRIFFIFLGLISILFFYEISRRSFAKREDAYLATTIFMFLPGMITGATLVSVAILVLPLVLLFVLLYESKHFIFLPLIMLALFFIHDTSVIFFLALLVYGIVHKEKMISILSAAFLLAFIYFSRGIDVGGKPSGHFVEIFGLYAAVFSPFVFFYFFYTMYRILLREKKTLLWYISFTALVLSLLLSIRQRIDIANFAPYVMISVGLMLNTFHHSLRVRLPQFQKRYILGFKLVMLTLLISAMAIFFHKVLVNQMPEPKRYSANNVYSPYFLSKSLKSLNVSCYDTSNDHERYQLQYYGIVPCRTNFPLK